MLVTKKWISEQDKEKLLLPAWQRLVDLMAELCGTPAGFIVQAGDEKYKVIIANESVENPYSANVTIDSDVNLFCREVVRQDTWLYVGNATEREEWFSNPEVTDDGFNTYLGYPLHWPDGSVFGTICVMDFVKTNYDKRYHKLMLHFREMAERELELLNKNIQLESSALSDDLTNLFNRKGFFFAAEQLLKTAKRDNSTVSVSYFDIDNLKPINDEFGHQVGDEIILRFADYLKTTFREVDVIARFGGDEFVVMCQAVNSDALNIMLERLQCLVSSQNSIPKLSYSYGFSSVPASAINEQIVAEMIKLADDEMYRNKGQKKQDR